MPSYLISYDVAADRRRARVAALLEDHGVRVQYSVFEVEVAERTLERLIERLRAAVDPTTDSVRAYPLCQRCRASVVVVGRGPTPGGDADEITVV